MKRRYYADDKGFTLLEVLIAVIILSIVSIPIIRSFVTVARTNADAKILLRATDAAENIMETIEYQTLDALITRYESSDQNVVTYDETTGKYVFTIRDIADLPSKFPDGYYMEIVADPGLYPNANALNIADVKSMSTVDSAVYEMSSLYEEGVYEKFATRSSDAHDSNPSLYQSADADYFKENLTRTLEVIIDKKGTAHDDAGDDVDLVEVSLTVKYSFDSLSQEWKNYLPNGQQTYEEELGVLFNNVSTKVPLSGVFIFYQPRYLATAMGNRDEILISNPDNVVTNVMIAVQNGASDANYKTQYFNATTGPELTVVENPAGSIESAVGAITLFTNLSSGAPYSSLADGEGNITNGKILCKLTYQNAAGTSKVIDGMKAAKILNVRDLDGKALIADNTKKRIYKIYVTVRDADGNEFVQLDGTKLE